jgi:anaerobic selenocysteine-containing dehydrogenase
MPTPAVLALEDGKTYEGRAFGAIGEAYGEIVFNTSMTGYQEVITDPSYRGQIVAMTYPLIGNYGVNEEDAESHRPWLEGFVVKELSRLTSNCRATKGLDEYLREAVEKWWGDVARPAENQTPRVLLEVAGSCLRRTRGGLKQLLNELWPRLKTIVTVEIRMSTTAHFSDIVLPAAAFYEKVDFRFPTWHVGFLTFTDKAVEPPGESKPEWEIFARLAGRIEERARERGLVEYQDARGQTFRLDDLYRIFTMDGRIKEKDE